MIRRAENKVRRRWEKVNDRLAEMGEGFIYLTRKEPTKGSLIGVNYTALISTVNDALTDISLQINLNRELHRHFELEMMEGYREMERLVGELSEWSERWMGKMEEIKRDLNED